MRTIHEVERGSNLDLLLRGFNGAFNKMAEMVGGGLQAIALALSTPGDNSDDVQKKLDELSTTLDQSTAELDAAVKASPSVAGPK